MRLRGDGNNLRQRENASRCMKFGLDLVRADVDEMALPVPTDRAMLALHGIKQALALDVDLLARIVSNALPGCTSAGTSTSRLRAPPASSCQ